MPDERDAVVERESLSPDPRVAARLPRGSSNGYDDPLPVAQELFRDVMKNRPLVSMSEPLLLGREVSPPGI